MSILLALALAGCAEPTPPPPPAPVVWVEARKVKEGEPVLLHLPAGVTPPEVAGLKATQRASSDDGQVIWALEGAKGSYILDVPEGHAGDGAVVPAVKLYLDIGVDGPSGGPMEDLAALPQPEPPRWPYALAAGLIATLATAGGMAAWRRFKPKPPPPPPEPADLAARKAWAAVRARSTLSAEEMAYELSVVYRRYLEAAHAWPATSRTTREIVDNLAGELTAAELDASRRLLGAMDLVKFAERETHAGLFEGLDHDFDRLCRPVVRSDLPALPSTRGGR